MSSHPPPPAATRAADHRWLILVIVSIAQLLVTLDATIVNIALPSAQADLGFADSQRQWIVTAYALAFGSLLLLGGRIGDMFGRKRVFIVGLAAFALASAAGGAADSFAVLVTARTLQGVAAALLAPAALSTLVTTFRTPRDRSRAFGVFASVAVSGGAVGLLLGGALTQYLSWRWAMYVNVVFAFAAGAGALIYMQTDRPAVRRRVDFAGVALASTGLFGLVFGFSHAESAGWSDPVTIGSLVVAATLLVVFVLVERRVAYALLPLRIITNATRAAAYGAVGIAGVVGFGVFLFLTFYLQEVRGLSPVRCGLAFLPFIGCVAISSNIANIVTMPRFGPRAVITTGMALAALGLGYLTLLHADSGYAAHLLPAFVVLGFGMGMVFSPATNAATAGVRPDDAGVAAALVSTMQQVSGSVGTALLSTVSASVTASYLSAHPGGSELAKVAATHGYVVVFGVVAGLLLVGAVLAGLLLPSKQRLEAMRKAAAEIRTLRPVTGDSAADGLAVEV